MSGGVRNLRAMFENSNPSTSPPDRGRSPAESIGAGSNGTSPRPLSKVRTSFVTVERSGQMGSQLGLKRETSGEPSLSKRRTSFSIDEEEDPKATAERKQSIAVELDARKNNVLEETIPEVAVETEEVNQKPQMSSGKERERGREPARSQVEEKKVTATSQTSIGTINGTSKPAVAKQPEKASASRTTTKPAPISTAKTNTAAKTSPKKAKTPVPKTPTTPRAQTAKTAERQPEKKPSRASLTQSHTSKPTSKPTTSAAHGSVPKTRIGASPPQTGFVKPKPRSPTRPVKLPASLTAHTASSGSKTSSGTSAQPTTNRQSLSRASGHSQATNSLQAYQAVSRSPSRASTATAPKSTLTRKPSSLNKGTGSRPSLGPPPSSQLKKQPSRQSLPAPADETFLARMMRSTASSASKTADKLPTTPPKKVQTVKRPLVKHEAPKTNVPTREKREATKAGPSISKGKEKETASTKPAPMPKGSKSAPTETQIATPTKEKKEPETLIDDPVPENPAAPEIPEVKREAESVEVGASITQATEVYQLAVEDVMIAQATIASVEENKESETPLLPEVIGAEVSPREEEGEVEGESENEDTPTESVSEENVAISDAAEEESDLPTVREPTPEKEIDISASAKEEPETTSAKEEVQLEAEIEVIPSSKGSKSGAPAEDPEDVKAREEIAKMNAELMKGAVVEPTGAAEKVEPGEDVD